MKASLIAAQMVIVCLAGVTTVCSGQTADVTTRITKGSLSEALTSRDSKSGNSGPQLLTWAQIESTLTQSFTVPLAEQGTNRFGYSSGVHCQLDNGNVLLDGHVYEQTQAELELPDPGLNGMAVRVGDWFDVANGLLPDGWDPNTPAYRLGGMIQERGRIHFTKHQWYNGGGQDWQTQGWYQGNYSGEGLTTGMFRVNGDYAHHSRVGGYVSPPPSSLKNLGYQYLAGQQGTSGAAIGRWGPNLFAILINGRSQSIGSRPLICHDGESHQLDGWWIANRVTSGVWMEHRRSHAVLFFVIEGLGQKWYGNPIQGNLVDPYGGYYGYHAEGWQLSAWIYDPDDLLDVFAGLREPWSLQPVEKTPLVTHLPGSGEDTFTSVFSGQANTRLQVSFRRGRLIVMEPETHQASPYERTPTGHVFMLGEIQE